MGNFYTDILKKDRHFNSTILTNDISLIEPETKQAVLKLISMAHEQGQTLKIGETYRSQARQLRVFKAGASKLKKVGCHGYGLAVDLQLFEDNIYVTDGKKYTFIPALARKVGLISGIDWGLPKIHHDFIDSGHVQRIPVFRQDALFAGKFYPEFNYNPYSDMQANGIKID